MSLKSLDFIPSPDNQYKAIDIFSHELCHALARQGVKSHFYETDRDNPKAFLEQIFSHPPDCTMSFNGLLPDDQGRFLCDLIKIPHIAFVTHTPHEFFPLLKSQNTIIACSDQDFCKTLLSSNFPYVLFLPLAVPRDLRPPLDPVYDVLMLNSFIDYMEIHNHWRKAYPADLVTVLEAAAEQVLKERDISYIQAFVETFDQLLKKRRFVDPLKLNYTEILGSLESYVSGKSRLELLKSINSGQVHVFGTGWQTKEAKKHFESHSYPIRFHEPIPFMQAIELMRRAKIVLNTTPAIKRGLHERVLAGLASGAAVLALETPFLKETFQDEEDILFFSPRNWDEVNQKIRFYLEKDNRRTKLAANGRKKILQDHTWDQRAITLVQQLPPLLDKIKTRN